MHKKGWLGERGLTSKSLSSESLSSKRLISKRIHSLFIISNLVLSLFAFMFIIWEMEGVSGITTDNEEDKDKSTLGGATSVLGAISIIPQAATLVRSGSSTSSAGASSTTTSPKTPAAAATAKPPAKNIPQAARPAGITSPDVKNYGITKSETTLELKEPVAVDSQGKVVEASTQGAKQINEVAIGRNSQVYQEGGKFYVNDINGNKIDVTDAVDKGNLKLGDAELINNQPYEDPFGLGISLGTGGTGMFFQSILKGFMWAGIAVGVIQMLGGLFGADQALINALSYGAFAGIMAGQVSYGIFGSGGWAGTNLGGGLWGATGIGIAVGLLVFALTYKDSNTETVNFQCNTWSAPKGGADCEKCNLDSKNYPCTEYKCRSLGAACQLLNAGTGEEKCAWVNDRDVTSPIIYPNYENISSGYQYSNVKIRPPGIGMEIKNMDTSGGNEEGCIEAFFPLQFGISTNEPTQCKIDYNHTQGFEDMQYFAGGSSTYKYNHTQTLSLPGPSNINREFPELKNDGIYNLFMRCSDPNGNVNEDEFAVKFCVKPGPDTTPPKIESTSLINGMPISFNTDTLNITVFTNEPSDCKWSREDKDYGVMENTMACARSVTEFNANLWYACNGKLTGIEDRKDNKFYFRCRDQPLAEESDKNVNEESYEFIVKGTQPLNILKVKPNGTIMGSTSVISVNLEVETANGFKDGDAICYYSTTGNENDYVKFFETGSFMHRQRQDLQAGSYNYYVKCVDLGGNADYNKTKFKLEIDDKAPRVVRVKHDSGESSVCGAKGCLQVTTDEESICSYSTTTCNFELSNGIKMPFENTKVHYAEWSTDFNYYIKCADKSNNQPAPTGCSMVVKAYNKK